jgi:uncharacterized membrane protein
VADLIAIAYPNENQAEQVLGTLRQEQRDYLVDLEDAVYVTKDQNGHIKVHKTQSLTGVSAVWGAFWGLLIGILFLVPLFGVIVGAGLGALFGHFTNLGIDNTFAKQVAASLQPGGSVLLVLVRKMTTDRVIPEIAKYGGTVMQTSLPADVEKQLEEALQKAQAAEAANPTT